MHTSFRCCFTGGTAIVLATAVLACRTEAQQTRTRVEIIGHAGHPVRITVKTTNLFPMPPSLFDGMDGMP